MAPAHHDSRSAASAIRRSPSLAGTDRRRRHRWTNGQAERRNHTVEDATVKAFHYPDLGALKAHVLAFVRAYNFAKHLKALRRRTPFEAVLGAWIKDPSIFRINPRHLIPGPNS